MRSVSELVGEILEPVLARRTGMTLDLIAAWPDLVGEEFRETTLPEKIDWPRRINETDPFKPATLVIACESSSALFFQHELGVVLERINVFFGFEAIARIRIVQKPVLKPRQDTAVPVTSNSKDDLARLSAILDEISDPELKQTLEKLGLGVLSKQKE